MKKRKEPFDATLFDPSDVTWEIVKTKRRDQVTIIFTSETSFNLIKLYLSFKMLTEKIELEMNILDDAEGIH